MALIASICYHLVSKSVNRLGEIMDRNTAEMVHIFWDAPVDAYFDQVMIAAVLGKAKKTLECDRWKKKGLPYTRIGSLIRYQKKDVLSFIESQKSPHQKEGKMSEITQMLSDAHAHLTQIYMRDGKVGPHDAWNEVTMGAAINGLGHAMVKFMIEAVQRNEDWDVTRKRMSVLMLDLVYGTRGVD